LKTPLFFRFFQIEPALLWLNPIDGHIWRLSLWWVLRVPDWPFLRFPTKTDRCFYQPKKWIELAQSEFWKEIGAG